MIVTTDLVEQIIAVGRDCEEAKLQAYRARPGNPNQIEFASFGKARAMRFPAVPYFNQVYGFGEDLMEQLPDIIRFYRETNTNFRLWLSPEGATEKVSRELVRHGFAPWGCHTKFYAGVEELAKVTVDSKVEAERVGQSRLDEFLAVMLSGWGMPPEHQQGARDNMRLRLGIPGIHLFLGRLDGEAVGGAVLYQKDEIGYFADAATPLARRGQGCQLKLMEARIHYARELGCKVIVGGAAFGNPSFRNMQRIGLKIAFTDVAWHYIGNGA